MDKNQADELCDLIRETSYSIHSFFGYGHLEKVYENALTNRLRKVSVPAVQQKPICVYDEDGSIVGDYRADISVDDKLLIELKAVGMTNNEHVAQVLGYLRASRIKYGLLINFGAPRLYIKRYVLDPI